MNYEDLSFEMNKDGMLLKCDVLSVIPNDQNKDEPYVVFTNYLLDDNDEFVMDVGKLVEKDNEFSIELVEDVNILSKIKEGLSDDVVSYVNKQVQSSLE